MTEPIEREELNEFLGDTTVYLSGPIRCVEDGGSSWRRDVEMWYDEEFDFINPLDQFDGSQEDVEFVESYEEVEHDDDVNRSLDIEVVSHDKNMILGSDFVFVGLENVISRGTMMEIMYAYNAGVPVYLWLKDGRDREEISPWVRFHSDRISQDLDELMESMTLKESEEIVEERVNHTITGKDDKQSQLLERAYAIVGAVEATMYYPVAHGEAARLQNKIEELENE